MKMKLRTKLIISYTALSVLLTVAFFAIANIAAVGQFNNYVQKRQEQKGQIIYNSVLAEFAASPNPNENHLMSLGEIALGEGIVLIVKDTNGGDIFCMICHDSARCQSVLDERKTATLRFNPNLKGEYTEKTYPIERSGQNFGTLTLGFYGPFNYSSDETRFMEILNTAIPVFAAVFLLVAVSIGVFMANNISKPLKAVTEKTQEIETGNYTDKIPLKSKTTEIDNLIYNVNSLITSLNTQQNLKRRMAMDYAHEFRTPLAAIQSNLEGIIDGVFEPETERIESIRQEILRLSRMVSEIDKITELQTEKPVLQKETFNFREVIVQKIRAFEAEVSEKNIKITLNAENFEIYADRDKIESVVMNLISNAVKYTYHNGKIDISLKKKKDTAELTVADNGCGIDENNLPHIFEHMYREDISRARNTGGAGIGLSVSKAITDAHRGKLTAASQKGVGSVFTVRIPVK
ncbi:MAG: HAMP domain-containing histidine kinase [Clostridiales bacterium]|jgi:signal transduction histidine kinase|nr:HAMP domain-containing histidine kinase [Clostridiales bacterium]